MDQPIFDPPPPDKPPQILHSDESDFWEPRLNPTQKKIFDEVARYILAHAEKASGKTAACLHALVRHCYEEEDALALIIAPQIRTGKDGVLYDLCWVLDIWRNGNLDKDGNRIDGGMGLEFTEPSLDPQTKDRCLFIGNRFGGWSKVMLVSIPYAEVVEKRMKALSPSLVYVDEITELESHEYFTYVSAQLGRRRGIRGPQQYIASCNPTGPSHWVYKTWFVDCIDEYGKRNQQFAVYHVPIQENQHNLPAGYIQNLIDILKDPTDRRRLLNGEWIDRPSGKAIFKNYWKPEICIRPTLGTPEHRRGFGLVPLIQFPLLVVYDPGAVNFSAHMQQMIPTKGGKTLWITFEEINFVGMQKPDFIIVPEVLKRMDFWQTKLGSQTRFIHISDEAAFSHLRPDGSYDALRMKQLSKGRINMRACPKAKDSVAARVRMLMNLMLTDSWFVSATCPKSIDVFNLLVSEKGKDDKYDPEVGLRPKRSPYIHPFDSMTYGPYYFQLSPPSSVGQTEELPPAVYRAGGRH